MDFDLQPYAALICVIHPRNPRNPRSPRNYVDYYSFTEPGGTEG